MSTPEDTRLRAALARHTQLQAQAREHQVQRTMAERDEAAALAELKDVYGAASFEAGVTLAADLKASYQAELSAFELAVQEERA